MNAAVITQYTRKLVRFESPTRLDWLLYFCFFTVLHIPGILNFYSNDGAHNAYLMFARSLEHGHLYLPPMPSPEDMILYHGNYYLPYPPLPSVLLLPLVAIAGNHVVNTVFVVLIMSCLNLYLMYKILVRLQVKQEYFIWIMSAFFFGSGYWYALFTSHHVYSFAQITSCTFQLLLINELFGKRRWWLAGVYIGCSFLTRQFTILYVLFALGYMWYLYEQDRQSVRFKDIVLLCLPVGLFTGIYLVYNYLRFGNPFDPGYAYILYNGVLRDRVAMYGVFSRKYFLFNFYSFFIKGFNIEFTGTGALRIKDMDGWGTSLLAASPFLVASVRARWSRPLLIGAWATIGVILLCTLFYHNNGYRQVNTMRFSLDFLPLLFVLTILGLKDIPTWLWKGFVTYAVVLNVLSFVIHFLYQTK
ncbi:MAG TPA: hypothetical protein VL727_04710 [Puia sp.]|jgi:hypothetical protein|nr:hypothetical protein [Puia sp.]